MQALPMALAVVGGAVDAAGTILGAKAEAKELRREADQLDVQAGLTRATSQRRAIDEKRQGRLAASRALAVAGASGGGVSDPTVVNAIADLEGESEYRSLTALYEGDQEALGMEGQADARRREAKNVKKASYFKAASTILKSGSTLADRYG